MTTTTVSNDFIQDAIVGAVQREASRIFDEHKVRMIQELDRDKDIIISGIVLHVMKYVQMETLQDSLVVTIREITSKT